ncbi:hypothetical protein JFT64_18475 [Pseudomonas carnis]|jgi:hypothetical protein|uniref:hypothetical protein n=1 Tax=Pseudomonas carnis TaxID=2487355 RepID=UPI0018E8900C|nr:hypothetical protein [Pseudomonas carnis]MBJ2214030.1 hypothetical protein [Pseudomonas carnis]
MQVEQHPHIQANEFIALARLSPLGMTEVRILTVAVAAVLLLICFDASIAAHFSYGTILVVFIGGVMIESLSRPLIHYAMGWLVHRHVEGAYGRATAYRLAKIYGQGGSIESLEHLRRLESRGESLPAVRPRSGGQR